MKPPRIGDLRHRLVLEAPLRTGDGGGGATVVWSPVAEIWAAVWPASGAEAVAAGQRAGTVSHDIVVRYRPGVLPAMRFRRDGRIFEILAVIDVDERGRRLRCLCREESL